MKEGRTIGRILLNIVIPLVNIVLICTLGPWLLRFFMPFVIGWCIAMIANPLVHFLENHLKLVRKHSSVVIVVVVLAGVIGVIYLLLSGLIMEIRGLIIDLPVILETGKTEIQSALLQLSHIWAHVPKTLQESLLQMKDNLGQMMSSLASEIAFPTVTVAGNVAKRIPGALVSSVVVILSSYFFIVERDTMISCYERWMPQSIQEYLILLKKDFKRLVGGYVMAQFRIMFVVAMILMLGFLILGVNHGVLLSGLIAVLDFLPMFGTGTALIPWAVVKLLTGEWTFALGLLLLYGLTQAVRQIIQPKIMGDSMGIPPFLTLFFLYLGFKVGGISGMILAVPFGILVLNLYQHGMFDSLITNCRLLVKEINRFRKEE